MLKKKLHIQSFVLLLNCLVLALLYVQITKWHLPFVGWSLFVLYLLCIGWWWKEVLHRTFGFRRNLTTYLLGVFAGFVILGLLAGIWAVWYRLTPIFIWASYGEAAIVSCLFHVWIKRTPQCHSKSLQENMPSNTEKIRFRIPSFLILIYIAGWMWALSVLWMSKSEAMLLSPWQTIPQSYLFIFFALTLLLGLFLFSQFKIKVLLFLVVLHSFLLHIYLPGSHILPWGGDVWRMLAVENKLLEGEVHPPVLFGDGVKWRDIGPVSVPEAFVIPHKYVYGQLWGSSVVFAKTTGIDLLQLNRWLVPVLWSLFFPLIIFRIGTLLFGSQRWGVWFAALSFLPFSFQVLGGLTLGVSLGYLTFFFALLLLLHLIRDAHPPQRIFVLFFAVLMVFGYTVHFLLFWSLLLLYTTYWGVIKIQSAWIRRVLIFLMLVASVFVFPAVELFSGASLLPQAVHIVDGAKQAIGQFSGWFYATQIRPHDIVSGNILFNHTPLVAFVPSIFVSWRWHVMATMIVLVIGASIGAIVAPVRQRARVLHLVLVTSGVTVWGGYGTSWFFLEGERLFVRRLDAALAFFLLAFFMYGIKILVHRWNMKPAPRTVFVFIITLLFSWTAMTTYASGPDMRVMSGAEYQAAEYVWGQIDQQQENQCVLADTWPLLAIEAFSFGRIVGGGFPINSQFAQPERLKIYEKILTGQTDALSEVRQYGEASGCWVIMPSDVSLNPQFRQAFSHVTSTQIFEDIQALFLPLKTGTE